MKKRDAKVLILVPNGLGGKGGIERLMMYLSREIKQNYDEVTLYVHATRFFTKSPFSHLSTPISLLVFCAKLIWFRPTLIHCNVAPRGSTWRKRVFVSVARLFGCKILLHLHGSGYDEYFAELPQKKKEKVANFFCSADSVVVLGNYWKNFAQTQLKVDPQKTFSINNGSPDVQSRANPAKEPAKICFAGAVGKRKGVDLLLDALALIPADLNWEVEIGGNGEIEKYRNRAKRLGIDKPVTFSGWLSEEEVSRLFSRSQIFVLPSRAENQPMSIIEAMAHKLPIISTRIGAIPEQVDDGVTGILVPSGDAVALAKALLSLLENPQLRERMGVDGRARFEANYSIGSNAAKFVALYKG